MTSSRRRSPEGAGPGRGPRRAPSNRPRPTRLALLERAGRIQLLVLDVDGVLTDGRITLTPEGVEIKSFDVKDGHGIRLALDAGIGVVWLSGRRSPVVERRARELGVEEVHQGARDKLALFEGILARRGLAGDHVAYVGDDVVDLECMRRSGLPVAVADALPAVRRAALLVTERPGGRGAVREVIDLILEARARGEPARVSRAPLPPRPAR